MLFRAASGKDIRRLLPGIVSLLHEAGAVVVMEGIETEAEAVVAMECDADLVQGYFFSKPDHDLGALSRARPPFQSLFDSYKTSEAIQGRVFQHIYQRYHEAFQAAVALLKEGHPLNGSCKPLFRDESVIRCYLLDPSGMQIGHTVTSQVYADSVDPRFRPLENAESADWFRRPYHRRALIHPGQLQITRPYLSITGAHMCSTLSMMFHTQSGDSVLCCDIEV